MKCKSLSNVGVSRVRWFSSEVQETWEKYCIGVYLSRAESDTSSLSHESNDFSESTSIREGLQM